MSGALALVSGWIEIVLDKTSGAPAATRPVEAGDAKFAKEQTASKRTGEKERKRERGEGIAHEDGD